MKLILLLLTIVCSTNVVANYPILESGGGGVSEYETLKAYTVDTIVWETTDFYKVLNDYTSTDLATDLGNSNLVKMVDPLDYLVGLTGNVQGQLDVHTTDIATNVTNIASNDVDIANNVTNIASNNSAIATNSTAIGNNATNITQNQNDITTNTGNIGTNATDIVGLQGDVATNTASIATNTADILTKANVTLNNLTSTSINASLIPDLDNSKDLGTSSTNWRNMHLGDLFMYDNALNQNTLFISGGNGGFGDVGESYGSRIIGNGTSSTIRGSLGVGTRSFNNAQSTGNLVLFTGMNTSGPSGNVVIKTGAGSTTRGKIDLEASELDMNSTIAKNGLDPVDAQDLATKRYVDINAGGASVFNAYTAALNNGAENGVADWNVSAPYLLTQETDSSLVLEGEASFKVVTGDVGGFAFTPLVDINKAALHGNICEAVINYKSDGPWRGIFRYNFALPSIEDKTFPAHPVYAPETIQFRCPSASEITGDANLGTVEFGLVSLGSVPSTTVYLDNFHIGVAHNYSETVLPDTCTAYIQNNGAVSVLRQTGDCIQSVTRIAAGQINITFTDGYNVIPTPQLTALNNTNVAAYTASIGRTPLNELTTSGMSVETVTNNTSILTDRDFTISISKQGEDAQQRVNIYKNIPKLSTSLNILTVNLTSSTAVGEEKNTDSNWWDSISRSNGRYTVNYASLGLVEKPSIFSLGTDIGNNQPNLDIISLSNTSFTIRAVENQVAVETTTALSIALMKNGVDFKIPTVQPLIIGQVRNSGSEVNKRNKYFDECTIASNSTFDSVKCPWIASIALHVITFTDTYVDPPKCFTTLNSTPAVVNSMFVSETTTAATVRWHQAASPNTVPVTPYDILCIGEK